MRPAPLGLCCAAVALASLAFAAAAVPGGKPATGAAPVGVSYGALTPQGYALWIRLRPDRQGIASLGSQLGSACREVLEPLHTWNTANAPVDNVDFNIWVP